MTKTPGIFLLSSVLLATGCGLSHDIYQPTSLMEKDRKSLFVLQGCGKPVKVNGEGFKKGLFANFILEPNKKHTLTYPKPNSGNMNEPPLSKEIMGKPGEVRSCQNVITGR